MTDLPKLTAAQDQMMDLLVARHRLGEPFWPIDNALRRTANELEGKGLITIIDGNVQGTFRAALSATARRMYMDKATYTSPLERELIAKIAGKLRDLGGDPTTIRMIEKMGRDK